MGSVDFSEPTRPVGVGTDGGVAGGVKVAVARLLVSTEDDAGRLAGGLFVQEAAGSGYVLRASIDVASEQ